MHHFVTVLIVRKLIYIFDAYLTCESNGLDKLDAPPGHSVDAYAFQLPVNRRLKRISNRLAIGTDKQKTAGIKVPILLDIST
jgi:hypothetical protein